MIGERYTILVVDDDIEVIDLLKDHFKRRDCEVIATQDPVAVVDKLRHFAVKLMLLDLKMQKLDGFQVLDKIKKEGLQIPPTIFITGYLPNYKDRLSSYGIDLGDVVEKPFNFEILEKTINRRLGKQVIPSEVGSEYENKIYQNNRCSIAIVEDEEDIRQGLKNFFEERNYKISCFEDGLKACAALKKERPDILITDIRLPGMQGDQLIRELKQKYNDLNIIAIFGEDSLPKDMESDLRELDCLLLSKPFDLAELIELIKTLAIEKKLLG